MYFVCDGKNDWWSCYGVLENGFCFGQHVCSHPNFAPGDLYLGRPERIKALKEVFGDAVANLEQELIVIQSQADIPTWWHEIESRQEELKPYYARYKEILGEARGERSDPSI